MAKSPTISQNFSTWQFFLHKYNLWFVINMSSVYTCRRRGSMVRCKPWSRWQDCPRDQGCTRGGTELPPGLYFNDFQHACWVLILLDFFLLQTRMRKHAMRKRTLEGQRTMFSLKICPPKNPRSLRKGSFQWGKTWKRKRSWKENPKPDGNAKIDGAPDNENALTHQPGFDKSSCIHCWERHSAPWPWPWPWTFVQNLL